MIASGRLLEHNAPRALADFVAEASRTDRPWTIPFPLGEDADQEMRFADLADGHVLVAGATGSGKTRFVQALIASISRTCDSDDVRMLIIDGKGLDLATVFRDLPHNLCHPITDIDDGIGAVNWMAQEMDRRRRILRDAGAPHIWAYRAAREAQGLALDLPALCLVIDEVQALTQTANNAMKILTRISQQGRASGILLVLATQRPTRNVIDPAIKANLPCRICFRVPSQVDSRVALDRQGAERLRHPGELIAVHPTMNETVRLRAPYVSEEVLLETVESVRLSVQSVCALPAANEAIPLLATVLLDETHSDDAVCDCNGVLRPKSTVNRHVRLAEAPCQLIDRNLETLELTTPSWFADVQLEASTIAKHIGQEAESLSLVYRPTIVLELSRRWRRRQLLVDVMTGRLFVSHAPPRSIPFLDVLADLSETERGILGAAVSGSGIPFDDPNASDAWQLIGKGLLDAGRRGFRINSDLRRFPSVRTLSMSMSMLPRDDAQVVMIPSELLRTTEERARREVAWMWRPGAIATELAGPPYWRWRLPNDRLLDFPAWTRPEYPVACPRLLYQCLPV